MENGARRLDELELPENSGGEFDEGALERAIRDHRRREFAALAQLNS